MAIISVSVIFNYSTVYERYPFVPEKTELPWMKYLAKEKKTTNSGILAMTAAANSAPSFVYFSVVNLTIYNGIVFISSLCVTNNGHNMLSHWLRNVRIPKAVIAGIELGITTRMKIDSSFNPSIRAASNKSSGKVRRNWRIMKIPKAFTRNGIISPI